MIERHRPLGDLLLRKDIVDSIEATFLERENDRKLIDILNGNLLTHLEDALYENLNSPEAFKRSKGRIPPINLLRAYVEKKSRSYSNDVTRKINDEDRDLVNEVIEELSLNRVFHLADKLSNTTELSAIQTFYDPEKERIGLRNLTSSQFTLYSDSLINPYEATHIILFLGEVEPLIDSKTTHSAKGVQGYLVYSKTETAIIDSAGNYRKDLMEKMGVEPENELGLNHFTVLNDNSFSLLPTPDTDLLRITLLLPLLILDCNYSAMTSAFPILYGIDVTIPQDAPVGPDVLWSLSSTGSMEDGETSTPQLGVIQREIDITSLRENALEQYRVFLSSRGIRPPSSSNTIGDINAYSSGFSRELEEGDDSAFYRERIQFLANKLETQFWEKFKKVLDYYNKNFKTQFNKSLSENLQIQVAYDVQQYIYNEMDRLKIIEKKRQLNALTEFEMITQIRTDVKNPEEIKQIIEQVKKEKQEAIKMGASLEFKTEEVVDEKEISDS
ncbi:hypothetical protein [uncultured Mediterranean phage uvMED]|nr:hypothetical protein [uncultured Mediterranean phage uvMED]